MRVRSYPAALLILAGCSLDTGGKGSDAGVLSGPSSGMADTMEPIPVDMGGGSTLDGTGTTAVMESGTSTGEPEDDPLRAYLGTFAAPAGMGVEAVTGVGFEPRAVLLWMTEHGANGSLDGARFGRGWTDGTRQGAVASAWESGGNASHSRWTDEACVTLVSEQGALLAEAAVESFDPDGFSLSWATPGEGRRVVFVALGGPIEARVGNLPLSSPTETVDTVGFSPDLVLLAGVETLAAPGTEVASRGGHGFGVVVPGIPTHSSAHHERNNGSGSSGLEEGVALVTAADSPPPEESYVLAGVDSDGFALNRGLGNGAIGTTWLAIRGMQASAGTIAQPTVAGDQMVPIGFEPVVVMFDGGDKAPDWVEEPEIVHGVAVGTGAQVALWAGREGGTTRSVWQFQRALVSYDASEPMVRAEAEVIGVSGIGFTLGWSTVDDVERRIGWFALGSLPPP